MVIQYVLGKIGNAGMSYSEIINANLVKIYTYCCTCDDTVDYGDFQNRIQDNCGVSASNVRMYSPFLFAHGFINNYKDGVKIKVSEYFTPLGKAYAKSLIIASKLKDAGQKALAENITKDILALSMFRRKQVGTQDYYFDFLRFCVKYNSISVKEFNYILYEKEMVKSKNYIDDIAERIQQYRANEIDFDFQQDRINKQGKQVRESFPDNTYNYTRRLLLESSLIIESDDRSYKINPSKAHIVRKLVEEA